MRKSIAVIMTVHNRREITMECISKFYQCRGIEWYDIEFYLMDDGSTDGTSEVVAKEYPQIILLKGDGNLFWNRGMYYCWKEAIKKHHDFYLWLNDDTMLFDNALEVLFKDLAKAGGLSVISGTCCDTATKSITTYGGRADNGYLIEVSGDIQQSEAINGNLVLIPNEVVERIGIIDPYFWHSGGDNEYSMRALKYGIPSYITSSFVATCDRHDGISKSENPQYPLRVRWASLNTPFGSMPKEKFYLNNKYKGFRTALREYLRLYYRCLFPSSS